MRPAETQPVVFQILRDSQCSQCKTELPRSSFLFMEAGQPLCLACADLDHLVYLPSGDTALTRRARKHSRLSAVVVRFSRSRKRYERQGLLVEEEGLRAAEEECAVDEGDRERRREQDAVRRSEQDEKLVEQMAEAMRRMFPACPAAEIRRMAVHTAARGSGRVGRSAAGRALEPNALRAAVTAAVRHRHTEYDELIMQGVDRTSARERVRERIDRIIQSWETAGS